MKKLVIKKEDLKSNLEIIKKLAIVDAESENNPEIIAVVKGNGMGLDLIEYSKFLIENGIKFLAVANFDEALKLRENEINEKILMLTPLIDKNEIETLIEKKIILTISNKLQLDLIEEILENQEKEVQVHLKIDTGFGRYGSVYYDFDNILDIFKSCKNVKIVGMYTHFYKAIDEKITKNQFDRFINVVEFLKKNGQDPGMLHCSASTAFLKYPIMNLNAVRLGSCIQGRVLVEGFSFKKIGTLVSNIQEIKILPKGYNISYGNMFKTKRQTKVAIIPVGYMDGLNIRNDRDIFSIKENILSVGIELKKFFKDNNIKVIINNKKYNIIGRIGMYHAIVDITKFENINVGDEVILNVSPIRVNESIRREYI